MPMIPTMGERENRGAVSGRVGFPGTSEIQHEGASVSRHFSLHRDSATCGSSSRVSECPSSADIWDRDIVISWIESKFKKVLVSTRVTLGWRFSPSIIFPGEPARTSTVIVGPVEVVAFAKRRRKRYRSGDTVNSRQRGWCTRWASTPVSACYPSTGWGCTNNRGHPDSFSRCPASYLIRRPNSRATSFLGGWAARARWEKIKNLPRRKIKHSNEFDNEKNILKLTKIYFQKFSIILFCSFIRFLNRRNIFKQKRTLVQLKRCAKYIVKYVRIVWPIFLRGNENICIGDMQKSLSSRCS